MGFNLIAINNPANLVMLNAIKQFFGVGRIIIKNNGRLISYDVASLQDCLIIRDHFLKFPLLTYKLVHFQL